MISHREFLGDIRNSSGFNLYTAEINPGLEVSFPWLNQVSASYECYKFKSLRYIYKSTMANVTTTSSGGMGTIVMMARYNPLAPAPTNKVDMQNTWGSTSFVPSIDGEFQVNCDQGVDTRLLYVRNSNYYDSTTMGDKRLWDLATFYLAVVGMDGAVGGDDKVSVGELWVEYEIVFKKPRFKNLIDTDHWIGANQTQALALGATGSFIGTGSTLGGSVDTVNRIYKFPPYLRRGVYFVMIHYTCALTGVLTGTAPTPTNCDLIGWGKTGAGGPTVWSFLKSGQIAVFQFMLKIKRAGAFFQLGNALGDIAGTRVDMWITECDDNIVPVT